MCLCNFFYFRIYLCLNILVSVISFVYVLNRIGKEELCVSYVVIYVFFFVIVNYYYNFLKRVLFFLFRDVKTSFREIKLC